MSPLAPDLSSRHRTRSIPPHSLFIPEENQFIDTHSTLFKRNNETAIGILNKYFLYIIIGGTILLVVVAYTIYRRTKSLRHSKEKQAVVSTSKEAMKKVTSKDNLRMVISSHTVRPAPVALGTSGSSELSYAQAPPNIMITPATASPSKLYFFCDSDDSLSLQDAVDELGYNNGTLMVPQDARIQHVKTSLEPIPTSDIEGQDIGLVRNSQAHRQIHYLTGRLASGGWNNPASVDVEYLTDLTYDRDEELGDVSLYRPANEVTTWGAQGTTGNMFEPHNTQSDDFSFSNKGGLESIERGSSTLAAQFPLPDLSREKANDLGGLRYPIRDTYGDIIQESHVHKYAHTSFKLSSPTKIRRNNPSLRVNFKRDKYETEYSVNPAVAINPSYIPPQTPTTCQPQPIQVMPRYPLHSYSLENGQEPATYIEASQGIPSSVVLASLASRIEANRNINLGFWRLNQATSRIAPQLSAENQNQD